MSPTRSFLILFLGLASSTCMSQSRRTASSLAATPHASAPLDYPAAERGDVIDDYHGVQVADPYRWLEDSDAPETRTWIAAENQLTRSWIDAIPQRGEIERRMTELWDFERFGVPETKSGKYFFQKNDGLQNQAVLYVADSLEGEPRTFIDPNTLSKDGTVALGATVPSEDAQHLAYMLSEAGSDWNRIQVRDVASGRDLADKIEWVKFSGLAWDKRGEGFYYSTYPMHDTTGKVPLKNQRLCYHKLGTQQSADRLVYERPDQPDWGFGGSVTHDGELLVISISQGTEQKSRVYVQDLRQSGAPIVPVLDQFDAEYQFLGKVGDELFFKTDQAAPRNRVIALRAADPRQKAWREVVPQTADVLESAHLVGGRIVALYLKDAKSAIHIHGLDGKLASVPELPGLGSIAVFDGEQDQNEAFFSWSSFTTPSSIYRLDIAQGKIALWRAPKVRFAPEDYVTKQEFYTSKDGTRVPLFLSWKKGLRPSSETPTLLYGYGGFNIPMKPEFRVSNLVWMERGGIYAVACIRGGSEYGREWHEAGTKEHKQNVFDDFIAAAEWMVANHYTSPQKLAIRGGSNGGLLIGACMTQRPELFGACLPAVGVLDMLRYQRFTIGWGWASDYGTADDPKAFGYLIKYSPLQNLKAGTAYPPTLVTTGDHDDRVVPAHSFKFAATLQHAQAGPNPVLIRIETRGGHGAGKPTAMQIEELADQWAFVEHALGMARPGG